MSEPRKPNHEEMELLLQKTMELFSSDEESWTEVDRSDDAYSLLSKSYIAVFDSWFFWDEVDEINYHEMDKLLVVFWPHRPDFFAVFTLTHNKELILIRQNAAMRELETTSST